jgi:predicted DCC family thiol-disulfide oxidoreductase YuxK
VRAVVLFDGVCNLCNRSVQFILDHEDPARGGGERLSFAPLQSELGRELLERAFGVEKATMLRGRDGVPESIVLVEGEQGWVRSAAALRIARYLRAPWRWSAALLVVPAILRDLGYRVIARNRYRWFGASETCRIPTPELRSRFLS